MREKDIDALISKCHSSGIPVEYSSPEEILEVIQSESEERAKEILSQGFLRVKDGEYRIIKLMVLKHKESN